MQYTEVDHTDLPQANLDGFARVKRIYGTRIDHAPAWAVWASGKLQYDTNTESEAHAFAIGWNRQKDETDRAYKDGYDTGKMHTTKG